MPGLSQAVYGLPLAGTRSTAFVDPFKAGRLSPWWVNPAITAQNVTLEFVPTGGFRMIVATASKRMVGIRMGAPSGAFSVMAQMQELGPNSSDIRAGIFAAIPGAKGHVCGPFNQDAAPAYIGVTTASDTADWSAFDGSQGIGSGSIATLRWFRIKWDGSGGISADHSLDRVTWTNLVARTGMSAPTEIGIGIYSNSAASTTAVNLSVTQWLVTSP